MFYLALWTWAWSISGAGIHRLMRQRNRTCGCARSHSPLLSFSFYLFLPSTFSLVRTHTYMHTCTAGTYTTYQYVNSSFTSFRFLWVPYKIHFHVFERHSYLVYTTKYFVLFFIKSNPICAANNLLQDANSNDKIVY